jgi:hypothetical protein
MHTTCVSKQSERMLTTCVSKQLVLCQQRARAVEFKLNLHVSKEFELNHYVSKEFER